jgi:hypothetical protein
MSHLETAVHQAVQAAVLNSECHPRPATLNALKAIAEFAEGESIVESEEQFLAFAKKAWAERKPAG